MGCCLSDCFGRRRDGYQPLAGNTVESDDSPARYGSLPDSFSEGSAVAEGKKAYGSAYQTSAQESTSEDGVTFTAGGSDPLDRPTEAMVRPRRQEEETSVKKPLLPQRGSDVTAAEEESEVTPAELRGVEQPERVSLSPNAEARNGGEEDAPAQPAGPGSGFDPLYVIPEADPGHIIPESDPDHAIPESDPGHVTQDADAAGHVTSHAPEAERGEDHTNIVDPPANNGSTNTQIEIHTQLTEELHGVHADELSSLNSRQSDPTSFVILPDSDLPTSAQSSEAPPESQNEKKPEGAQEQASSMSFVVLTGTESADPASGKEKVPRDDTTRSQESANDVTTQEPAKGDVQSQESSSDVRERQEPASDVTKSEDSSADDGKESRSTSQS